MSLSKKQKFVLVVTVSIAIAFGGTGLVYYMKTKPITHYNFYGAEFEFRDDLREAENIPIYPDKETILNTVWNPDIHNITVVYIDSANNSIVAVNAFEITYKLTIAYSRFNWFIEFVPMEVTSFENLKGSNENLIIALVPPALSDETKVELIEGVVYVKGATVKDFDQATIKFLMTSMNITI
ncbi:MAG: hypothetical protein HYW24_00995 [Candidatus Aenigmarchaeota archaeon]|nr:hypothetical protein [Candidatus Aenigmarchaeota archaeon]